MKKLLYIFRLNVPEFFAPNEEDDFKSYLNLYSDQYYSITFNGFIIGGAGYKIDTTNSIGSISWIFLHPDYFGKKIGKEAVTFLLEKMSKMDEVEIFRAETSQHGYKFFGSFGFTTVKKEKGYWGKGLDLYRMEMRK